MRRLPLAFFALLGGASLLGLVAGWLINSALYGRPHGALLQLLAETAAAGIDCQDPQRSPLFLDSKKTPHLQYRLLDATQVPPGEGTTQNFPWQPTQLWVKVPRVCDRPLTLWALDANNQTYRHLMLPRLIILFISCSASIILVVMLTFLFIRRKGVEARFVLQRIREGAFGSRIPQRLWEPRLQLIEEFNRMTGAVEDSFQRLHQTEERRARLLSELAHDVRTPLASLRAAAETLIEFQASLTSEKRSELQATLFADLLYFQTLIDDLLILAQLDRLDNKPVNQSCDLKELLQRLWSAMQARHPRQQVTLIWPDQGPEKISVPGDEALVRRLLQNALDNAFHYALTQVICTLTLERERIVLRITNDTRALGEEELNSWGHKRRQRITTEKAGQAHTSLGLGSSIITSICRHLGGQAWIRQSFTHPDAVAQITVFIELPQFRNNPSRYSE